MGIELVTRSRGAGFRSGLILAAVLGLMSSAILASPVGALPENYKDEYMQGPHRFETYNSNYAGDTFSDGSALNDETTSVNNWTPYFTCWYIDANYSGIYQLRVQPWVNQVHVGSLLNDEISSHHMDC